MCKALVNGKCKLHGGLSTGPKTEEGRARIAAAQRARWQRAAIRVLGNQGQDGARLEIGSLILTRANFGNLAPPTLTTPTGSASNASR